MPDFYQINNSLVGAQVLNGAAAPTSGIGANGDFYIQTSGSGSPKLWGPKASGAWPASGTSLAQSAATDPIYDAVGDLVVGTGADTAARFAKSATKGQSLVVGSSTLEWDANHFGGGNFFSSNEATVVGETVAGASVFANSTITSASGQSHLHGIYLPKNTTISYITFFTGGTGITGPTNQWFALCNSSRVVLRVTVNDTTTAWGAATSKRLALTSSYTTTYSGLHYLACAITATGTMPTFRGLASSVTTNLNSGMHSFLSTNAMTTPVAEGATFAANAGRVPPIQGIVSS